VALGLSRSGPVAAAHGTAPELNSTVAETATTPKHRQRLHRLAHDLKGVAGTLGYIAIQRAAYDLAEATRGSGDVDTAALVSRLVVERDRFRRHYQHVDDDDD